MKLKNQYALITGAAGGLGRALSVECAKQGFDLMLVDLPGTDLRSLACFIERNYPVRVQLFETDLCIGGKCEELFRFIAIKAINIRVLINNAAVGGTSFFKDNYTSFYDQQIKINVIAPTLLCKLFLDYSNAHAGDYYILNIGSMAADFNVAGKNVYAATKSFLESLSKSLRYEVDGKHLSISVLKPGPTNTTFNLILKHRKFRGLTALSIMDPRDVAAIGIKGMFDRKKTIIPGYLNRCMSLLSKILPVSLIARISERQMKMLIGDELTI